MGSLSEVLKQIRNPSPVESFTYNEFEQPTITIVSRTSEDSVTLSTITPFHTFEELLRDIWLASDKSSELFPNRVFLAEQKGDLFYPVLYDFLDIKKQEIGFEDPRILFANASAPDLNNTTRTSDRKNVLLETRYPNWKEEQPVFVVFSYESLKKEYMTKSDRSIDAVWDTLVVPFFGKGNDASFRTLPSTVEESKLESLALKKRQNVLLLQNLLAVETKTPTTTSTKLLKLVWKKRESSFEGVGILFFQASVTEKRPYMRYLPSTDTPLTKLYQENPAELPQVHDPKLLKGWTEIVAPIPGKEFLITKPLLREEGPLTPPLFGTFYAMDDATGLLTIQPPKGVRFLNFDTDTPLLMNTDEFTSDAFGDMTPFDTNAVDIGTFTCVLRFEFESPPSTAGRNFNTILAERLGELNTLFRQSGVVDTDITKPFLALRYKAVSNYKSESEVFTTIKFLFQEQAQAEEDTGEKISPEMMKQQILKQLQMQFDINESMATKYYDEYNDKLVVVNAQQEEFIPTVSLPITLLFKGYSPKIFDVYCYNINSLQTLQRIATILSKVFYLKDDQWRQIVSEATAVAKGEEEESEEAEEDEEGEEEEEDDESDEEADEEEEAKPIASIKARDEVIDPRSWYLNRLYALDKVLFKPEREEGKPAFSYVEKCQANYDRQPAGLTYSEFMDVWKEYTESKRLIRKIPCNQYVKLIVYGVENTKQLLEDAKGAIERIIFIRYGSSSDPKKANYYTCSRLFCLRDVMPILEEDYISELRADGKTPKPKKSCPFCGGLEIKNRDIAGVKDQTVLERRPKPSKPQTATGFLRSAGHPKGYEIPCCGVKQTDILWDDPRFSKYRATGSKLKKLAKPVKTAVEEAKEEEDDEAEENEREEVEDLRRRASAKTNYSMLRFSLSKQYVKSAIIYPLDEGTIGCPQIALDELFGQKSSDMVTRTVVRQEFRTEAKGLFRLGVRNKPYALHNSFFAAIAPMLGLNTADEVASFFELRIQPLIFLSLNFGNLVMEFFDPSDEINNGSDDEVNAWGQKIFIKNPIESTPELHRFFNSYRRFKDYILGINSFVGKTKQMRHFVYALSEPGLILSEGLTLMILHYIGDPRSGDVEVKVKCPIMGLDITRYANNQIGFITYSEQGFWEPMIYVDQIQRKDTSADIQEGYYTVDRGLLSQDTFPDAIKQQVQQFTSQCKSAYRGAFTYQSQIDSRLLLPVTKLLSILSKPDLKIKPSGLVRDSYNHLVAITVQAKGTDRHVLVPVVDDGNSFHTVTNLKTVLSLSAVEKAYANEVYAVYQFIAAYLAKYNTLYDTPSFVKKGDELIGYQLGGQTIELEGDEGSSLLTLPTILLPCEPTSVADIPETMTLQIEDIREKDFQFEFEINRSIIFGNPAKPITSKEQLNSNDYSAYSQKYPSLQKSVEFIVTQKQIENIYEHLRLTFSKYINDPEHSELKKKLETKILENRRIPDFEKIKRLDILLRSTITSWLAPGSKEIPEDTIFVRRDCLKVTDETQCDGYCSYTAEGQCKIHIPKQVTLDPERTIDDAVNYFCNRLFVELARLPAKRIEMMNDAVNRIQIPRTNVHVGDQWILPENVPAWDKLLLETSEIFTEKPRFYEEFSRSTESTEELLKIAEMDRLAFYETLPEEVKSLPLFTDNGKKNVIVKTIEGTVPTTDILEYFGLDEYARQRKAKVGISSEYFTRMEFLDLCNLLKSPIIQIYKTEEGIMINAYKTKTTSPTTSTYIFLMNVLQDAEDEQIIPAIFFTKDQLNPTIPLSYLLPDIEFEMVRVRKLKKVGLKPLPPAAAAAPPAEEVSDGEAEI